MQPKSQKSKWPRNWWVSHFEDEPFLTEAEWRTYQNRPPVRYTGKNLRKHRPAERCEVCGKAATAGNPLQSAHLIPFFKGVQHLALTPAFVDNPVRLKWAHRKDCNARAGLGFTETLKYLRRQGIKSLPQFLNPEVLRAWEASRRVD